MEYNNLNRKEFKRIRKLKNMMSLVLTSILKRFALMEKIVHISMER